MTRAPSYFVVMVRYPDQRASEAVVNPEYTRGKIIDLISKGEFDNIEFIHEIANGQVHDVTDDLVEAARELELQPHPIMKLHDDAIKAIKEWVEA